MKLILCRECVSVVSLNREARSCACGKSQGAYLTNLKAIYSGPCVPLGFDNNDLVRAVGEGGPFGAFVISFDSPNFRRVDDGPFGGSELLS